MIAVKDAQQITRIKKEVMDVIPTNHNVNIDAFVERLYLRGIRSVYDEPISGEEKAEE